MDPSKIASNATNAANAASGAGSAMGNVGLPNIGGSSTQTPGVPSTPGIPGMQNMPGQPNNTTSSNENATNNTPNNALNENQNNNLEAVNENLGDMADGDNEELPNGEESSTGGEPSNGENLEGGGNPEEEGPKPGDKAGTGKQVGENGEIEDSSTKKTVKAIGRGAAAYFTGGESIGKDQQIANMKPVDDAIGVVSDKLDKVPGVEQISKELDKAGLADGVNDVLDTVGNAKNGDIKGAVESGKKAVKDVDKAKKYAQKKVLMVVFPAIAFALLGMIIFVVILSPVLGGFLDLVEDAEEIASGFTETVVDEFIFDNNGLEVTANIISEIEGFENLSEARQKIVAAAASAVAAKTKYSYGSHPHGPGLTGIPSAGLDCAGFVQWALWTGLGGNPGYLTTQVISNKIGTDFIQISESELQPGDIGLKRTGGSEGNNYNHTGIYVGNNQWIHASNSKTGVIRGSYSEFTIFLRYKGVT